MLRLAANLSLLWADRPLEQRFAAARAAGFAAVEIQFPYALPVDTLADLLAQHRLRLVLINAPAGDLMDGGDGLACVPGREGEFARALDAACDYAHRLSVPTVNVLAGRLPPGVEREAALATLTANLTLAAQRLENVGARCAFEAINRVDMPRFLVATPDEQLALLARVDHANLALQFDAYHAARMGLDPCAQLERCLPHTGHIQFADAPGRGAPGSGELDFAALFRLIAQSGYAGWCGAEYLGEADRCTWRQDFAEFFNGYGM